MRPSLQLTAGKYFHSVTVIDFFFLIDQKQHAVQCLYNFSEDEMTTALFRYDRPLQLNKGNTFLSGAFFSSYQL